MSNHDKDDKNKLVHRDEDEDESGATGSGQFSSSVDESSLRNHLLPKQYQDEDEADSGTQSGSIEFSDFLSSDQYSRDDLLPPDEKKRLLAIHQDLNAANVLKQKEKKDQYKALKEGKITLNNFRQTTQGMNSAYQVNPILADKAQFSGIDAQVHSIPSEYNAETNQVDADKLENEFQLRYALQNAPRFNPKPQFR